MWVQVELPEISELTQITLDAGTSTGDYPRGYEVVASVDGKSAITKIKFPATVAKFLKITQTKRHSGLYWSIHEMSLNGKELAGR